jgi:hypothetical protein
MLSQFIKHQSLYYYLGTVLPDLAVGKLPEISFQELKDLLKDNLSVDDEAQTRLIRRLYDILNIRALWLNDPLDPHGNDDENELEEALISEVGLPNYVYDFLDSHESQSDRLLHFPGLIAQFFSVESAHASGFLKEYLSFERSWRLVMTALRSKRLGRDLLVELQYENPDDPLVAQILSQKDAKAYEPPEEFQDLKALFEKHHRNPLDLEQALCEYRFNHIDHLIAFDVFSTRRILAFVAQFIIVEKWIELDKKKGTDIIHSILKELS